MFQKKIMMIDCQGTFDSERSTPTLDNLTLYIGLQLSDVLILNVRSQIQSTDFERLEVSLSSIAV